MIQGSHNLQPIHPHLESAFWFVNLQNVLECSAAAHDVTGEISQIDTLASPLRRFTTAIPESEEFSLSLGPCFPVVDGAHGRSACER